jgi:hypothetical protein
VAAAALSGETRFLLAPFLPVFQTLFPLSHVQPVPGPDWAPGVLVLAAVWGTLSLAAVAPAWRATGSLRVLDPIWMGRQLWRGGLATLAHLVVGVLAVGFMVVYLAGPHSMGTWVGWFLLALISAVLGRSAGVTYSFASR